MMKYFLTEANLRYSYQTSRQTPVWILIGVNFLIFLTCLITDLENNLALWLYALPVQPWTIVTSMFTHANFSHIIFNMLTLFFFGTFLLQLVGAGKFWLVYFVGGIVGNLLFLLTAYFGIGGISAFTPIVGASGAIYGIGGTLVAMRPKQRVFVFPIPVPMPLWIAIIGGFLLTAFSYRIAWQAHLGGLIVGLIAGLIFRRQERRRSYRF